MSAYPKIIIQNGNYAYSAFATSNTGADFSLIRDADSIDRCYHAIYASDTPLDTEDPGFPNYFSDRWFNICCDCDQIQLPTITFYMRALEDIFKYDLMTGLQRYVNFPMRVIYEFDVHDLQDNAAWVDLEDNILFQNDLMNLFLQIPGVEVTYVPGFNAEDNLYKIAINLTHSNGDFNFQFANASQFPSGYFHFGKIKLNNDNTVSFSYKYGLTGTAIEIGSSFYYDINGDNIPLGTSVPIENVTEL